MIPLGADLLCQVIESVRKSPGGIIIPDTASGRPNKATVLAVGRDATIDKGATVIFDAYAIKSVLADGALANAQNSPYAGFGDKFVIAEEHIFALVE